VLGLELIRSSSWQYKGLTLIVDKDPWQGVGLLVSLFVLVLAAVSLASVQSVVRLLRWLEGQC